MNELIIALVTGGLSLLGTVITVIVGFKQTSKQVDAKTTLTLYRIEQLERKQDKHNTLELYRRESADMGKAYGAEAVRAWRSCGK